MRRLSMKALAVASISVLALGISNAAYAQTETVTATFITSGALTTDPVSNFDFGEYFILIDGVETPTLAMADNGAVTLTPGGITNSTVYEITAPTSRGAITVTVPAPAMALTLTRDSSTNFTDAGLDLTVLTYSTANDGNGNDISTDLDTGTVTTTGANTAETISFGATITIGPQPANGTHTADFDVTLSF